MATINSSVSFMVVVVFLTTPTSTSSEGQAPQEKPQCKCGQSIEVELNAGQMSKSSSIRKHSSQDNDPETDLQNPATDGWVAASRESTNKKHPESVRIVGGINVESPRKYPWHVAIKRGYKFVCSGALISPRYALTAASCFFSSYGSKLPPYKWRISLRTVRLFNDDQGTDIAVDKIIVHNKYVPHFFKQDFKHNIALTRLEHPVQGETSMPACLPLRSNSVELGDKRGVVTGWGKRGNYGPHNNLLQELKLTVQGACKRDPSLSIFCTEINPNKNLCKGDIGSPLVVDEAGFWILEGIAISETCGYQESEFTSVRRYLDWVTSHIQGDGLQCFD